MFTCSPPFQATTPTCKHPTQGGVVLIISLIMLVIISLMAAMSVRNATSSEAVNANVRQTQLASQAAETALRYCEEALISMDATTGIAASTATFAASPPSSTAVTFSANYIDIYRATPLSISTTFWDSTGSSNPNVILVLPAASVNRSGITSTFSRPPECIVERLVPSTASNYSTSFNITARGFGPEVAAADASRTRPVGSEVFMQSSLELVPN